MVFTDNLSLTNNQAVLIVSFSLTIENSFVRLSRVLTLTSNVQPQILDQLRCTTTQYRLLRGCCTRGKVGRGRIRLLGTGPGNMPLFMREWVKPSGWDGRKPDSWVRQEALQYTRLFGHGKPSLSVRAQGYKADHSPPPLCWYERTNMLLACHNPTFAIVPWSHRLVRAADELTDRPTRPTVNWPYLGATCHRSSRHVFQPERGLPLFIPKIAPS